MIILAWPWVLAALPAPWLARRWLPAAAEAEGAALRVPFFEEVAALRGGVRGERQSQILHLGLAWVAWLLLLLAAARPQWLGDPVALPQTGRDLMLAVDISGSMGTPDMDLNGQQATRLDVVKDVAGRFIRRRVGDRIGLILFGTQAYLQTPLTFDRTTARTMLDEAAIGLAGDATAIGDAIGLAVKRLRHGKAEQRVLILLSDGANTAGEVDPRQAAALAAEAGLKIYTIGIGAEAMRVAGLFGSTVVNPSSDLDERTLRDVAKATGGAYFRARDTRGLERIYHELDKLEPAREDGRLFRPVRALFYWPLAMALLLSALLAARRLSWLPRLGARRGLEAGT
jgi:Ca-activated chloride channel homolog